LPDATRYRFADIEGAETAPDALGAVYGFLSPNQYAARKADEWQTFDIALVGAS